MLIPSLSIQSAEAGDESSVLATITAAFMADPVLRWMYPDPGQYLTFMPALVRAFGGRAFDHGSAHIVPDRSGAALWLPPGVEPDEEALVGVLQASLTPPVLADVLALLELLGSCHPAAPHWYAPLIGVDPLHQRQGRGTALLEQAVAGFDRTGTLAYLDSTNEENIPFYQRHGFELMEPVQTGASPPLFPLVRTPR